MRSADRTPRWSERPSRRTPTRTSAILTRRSPSSVGPLHRRRRRRRSPLARHRQEPLGVSLPWPVIRRGHPRRANSTPGRPCHRGDSRLPGTLRLGWTKSGEARSGSAHNQRLRFARVAAANQPAVLAEGRRDPSRGVADPAGTHPPRRRRLPVLEANPRRTSLLGAGQWHAGSLNCGIVAGRLCVNPGRMHDIKRTERLTRFW
jgi:hypothetical protein